MWSRDFHEFLKNPFDGFAFLPEEAGEGEEAEIAQVEGEIGAGLEAFEVAAGEGFEL